MRRCNLAYLCYLWVLALTSLRTLNDVSSVRQFCPLLSYYLMTKLWSYLIFRTSLYLRMNAIQSVIEKWSFVGRRCWKPFRAYGSFHASSTVFPPSSHSVKWERWTLTVGQLWNLLQWAFWDLLQTINFWSFQHLVAVTSHLSTGCDTGKGNKANTNG